MLGTRVRVRAWTEAAIRTQMAVRMMSEHAVDVFRYRGDGRRVNDQVGIVAAAQLLREYRARSRPGPPTSTASRTASARPSRSRRRPRSCYTYPSDDAPRRNRSLPADARAQPKKRRRAYRSSANAFSARCSDGSLPPPPGPRPSRSAGLISPA